MAGFKLTQLTEDTAPHHSDIGYSTKDPASTPLDRKVTWLNVLKGAAKGILTTNGDLFTLTAGVLDRLTRADLATDIATNSAFSSLYASHSAARAYKNAAAQTLTTAVHTFITLDAEYFDDATYHFTSSANLTGTVAKNGTTTLTGTGTAFTTELAVGQAITVPGTNTEIRVVSAIASNTSLTVSTAFAHTASGQTAARFNCGFVAPVAGRYRLTAQLGFNAAAGGVRQSWLVVNPITTTPTAGGTATGQFMVPTAGAGVSTRVQVTSGPVDLAQWDHFALVGYQDSGGNVDVATGSWATFERLK